MIDFDAIDLGVQMAGNFGQMVAQAAHAATGFDFAVRETGGIIEIVTSHTDAVKAEYGDINAPGGSWSVKAILEAERNLNEHASGGV